MLRDAAFDLYVVLVNVLLRLPGHALRVAVLRGWCGWEIGEGCSIERGVQVTTRGGVRVGDGSVINHGTLLDGRGGIVIGRRVNISPEVAVLTADHDPDSPSFEGRNRSVTVDDRAWVSTRAIVLPGAEIGEGAAVGAGSVVNGVVDPWTIVAGVPAAFVRARDRDAQQYVPRYRRWFH